MQVINPLVLWPTVAVVITAAATDLRSRRIPNWLVVPFLIAGLIASSILHGWSGLGHSLFAVAIAAGLMGFFCYLGGMGMGDVKLCAAIGAWIGPTQLLAALLLTALAGGLMAICWALARGFLKDTLHGIGHLLTGFRKQGLRPHPTLVLDNPVTRKMPYAPAIAIGTIVSFLGR
jgi:prepilin peptidase CpaA